MGKFQGSLSVSRVLQERFKGVSMKIVRVFHGKSEWVVRAFEVGSIREISGKF